MKFFRRKKSNGVNEEVLSKLSEWYLKKIREGIDQGKIREALLKQFNSETADFIMDYCKKKSDKTKRKVVFVDEVDDIKEYEKEKAAEKPSETCDKSKKTNISDLFSDPDKEDK